MKQDTHANSNYCKKRGLAIFNSQKIDFKVGSSTSDKKGHFTTIK